MNLRIARLAAAASCPLLLIARWFDLGTIWTLPIALLGFACGIIVLADGRHARGDDKTVVLNLHR